MRGRRTEMRGVSGIRFGKWNFISTTNPPGYVYAVFIESFNSGCLRFNRNLRLRTCDLNYHMRTQHHIHSLKQVTCYSFLFLHQPICHKIGIFFCSTVARVVVVWLEMVP